MEEIRVIEEWWDLLFPIIIRQAWALGFPWGSVSIVYSRQCCEAPRYLMWIFSNQSSYQSIGE